MKQFKIREETSSGIFFQYMNSIAIILAGFIFYIYIIRFYSVELVGAVSLLITITSLLNIFFSLGLGYGLQHYISYYLGRREYGTIKRLIAEFSLLGFALAFLSLVFLYLFSPIFASLFFHTFKYILLVKYLGLDLCFMVLSTFLGGILIGLQNFKSQAIWNIAGILISYSLPVILLAMLNNSLFIVIGWATGYALSSFAYSILIIRKLKNIQEKSMDVKMSPIFRYSFPLFFSLLIGVGASYIDRFIVSYLLNLSLLGIYNFALLISSSMGLIIYPFSTILLPKISEMYGLEKREEIKNYVAKGIELISAIYVPVAMLVAALSSSILLFLSKEEYLAASIPVTIVLAVNSIFVSGNILSISLQGIRKTRIFIITSSSALLSNFIISILLIPRYQLIGASIGYSSISMVSFFVLYYYAKKFDIKNFEKMKIAKIYISAFAMFFVILWLQDIFLYSPIKLFIYLVLGFIIYSGLIKAMKTFSKQDMDFIMTLIPSGLQKLKGVIFMMFF